MTRVLNVLKDYILYLMIAHGVILTLLRNKRVKNISVKLCKKKIIVLTWIHHFHFFRGVCHAVEVTS